MFSFDHLINLPMLWGLLISVGVLMYVLLDGFDLGVGILFPFAPSDRARTKMMNSVLPYWDGNETWIILGGGGLFAAFPLAYAVIFPALYVPLIAMLLCLILRGVSFEFRYKGMDDKSRYIWDAAFHVGSVGTAFFQGVALGGYLQGIEVYGREFAGGSMDWLSAFSVTTGCALVFCYGLLGAAWLVMKTEGRTQSWARKVTRYVLPMVAFFMLVICLWVPSVDARIQDLWFSSPGIYISVPLAVLAAALLVMAWVTVGAGREYYPFILSVGVMLLGFVGLALSVYPWIVPYTVTIWEAAAAPGSLSLMLVGVLLMLPVVLFYTGYIYWVFRGKVGDDISY